MEINKRQTLFYFSNAQNDKSQSLRTKTLTEKDQKKVTIKNGTKRQSWPVFFIFFITSWSMYMLDKTVVYDFFCSQSF